MKSEIRIYFECLEQILHYILPLVKEGMTESKINAKIKFIRKPKQHKKSNGSIAAIYSLTTPDVLITLCKNKKEIPLLMGEFSEAVTTEDHELQRAIGGIAAALSNCIYFKISGRKESVKEHGGKKDFNPLTVPKILKQAFGYDGYVFGEWPTADDNPYILKRDKNFLSCPPKSEIPLVEEVLRITIKEGLRNFDDILSGKKTIVGCVLPDLENKECYKEYIKLLKTAPGLKELVNDWKGRKGKGENKEPRILLDENRLIIKINRFSHAADPDRGILIFASTLVPANVVLARYKVKQVCAKTRNLINEFINQSLEEGLPEDFVNGLKKYLTKTISKHTDTTDFLIKNKNKWENNKVLSAIFLFSDGIVIHDKDNKSKILLTWNRKQIFGIKDNLKNSPDKLFGFKQYDTPLRIMEVNDVNEDEVSYIVVHGILKPNNFDIVSVSYPGAQGDAAILPEKGKGRKQSRLYIDVIAWLPNTDVPSSNITLEESKDSFNANEINKIIKKLDLFRTDKEMTGALIETLNRLNHMRKLGHIFIGVAFGVKNITTKWEPYKVDYLVRIFDRDRWQVASFGDKLKSAFKIVEGKVNLPKVYKVIDSI